MRMVVKMLMRLMRMSLRVGYRPALPAAPVTEWACWQAQGMQLGASCPSALAAAETLLCLPTYVARCGTAEHALAAERCAGQVAPLQQALGCDGARLIIALQYTPGARQGALERCSAIYAALPPAARQGTCFALIGGLGKVAALNCCIAQLRAMPLQLRYFGWLDDDIRFAPTCFADLRSHLERHPGCDMAGAQKVPVANTQAVATWYNRLKRVAKSTAVAYPHGCALLLRWPVIADGMPAQFTSDDGYLAMALFDEHSAQPFHRMAIVPAALCWHVVGGPAAQIWGRVHRTIYENILLLSYFPISKSARFFHSAIIHGLHTVPRSPRAALNSVLKLVLIGLYLRACCVLLLWGALGRPMRDVNWSPYLGLNLPQAGGGAASRIE
jgi:hypothetical protein